MNATGPTYPDLWERLEQRADEEHDGQFSIEKVRDGWIVSFRAGVVIHWGLTFQEAALAALRRE